MREIECTVRRSPLWGVPIYLLIVALIGWIALRSCTQATTSEIARRASCIGNLCAIFRAVKEYERQKGVPPPDLVALVGIGLLDEASLLCPSGLHFLPEERARYQYHLDAWMSRDEPVVTEAPENHAHSEGVSKLSALLSGGDLEPVSYAMFSDGRIENALTGSLVVQCEVRPSETKR